MAGGQTFHKGVTSIRGAAIRVRPVQCRGVQFRSLTMAIRRHSCFALADHRGKDSRFSLKIAAPGADAPLRESSKDFLVKIPAFFNGAIFSQNRGPGADAPLRE